MEVGCGEGEFLAEVAASTPVGNLIGVDLDKSALSTACTKVAGGRWSSRTAFVLGDAYRLPFQDATIDAIVFRGLLHHLRDIDTALDQSRRALAPGGLLFVQDGTQMPREEFDEMNEGLRQKGLPQEVHPGFRPVELVARLRTRGFGVDQSIEEGFAVFASPPQAPRVYATPLFLLIARRIGHRAAGA